MNNSEQFCRISHKFHHKCVLVTNPIDIIGSPFCCKSDYNIIQLHLTQMFYIFTIFSANVTYNIIHFSFIRNNFAINFVILFHPFKRKEGCKIASLVTLLAYILTLPIPHLCKVHMNFSFGGLFTYLYKKDNGTVLFSASFFATLLCVFVISRMHLDKIFCIQNNKRFLTVLLHNDDRFIVTAIFTQCLRIRIPNI